MARGGGGGGCHIVGGSSTGGKWKVIESDFHINYLELLAVLYALKSFFKTEHGLHIRICSDNSCAVAYINHMVGTHSRKLNFLARCIWAWCIRHNFWLTASHIPGPDNHLADFFSRNFKEDIEWCLNREVFLEICNRFGEPDLDLFASRLNRQTLNFVSWFPDPEALMTDAFSFSWAPFFSYGFPPFCLLNKLLAKVRSDSAMGIFILLVWPTQPWFPAMLHLLAANPVMLLQSENLLFLPFSNKKHHLLPQVRLMACLLSGCRLETEEFLSKQPELSLLPGETLPRNSIWHRSNNGVGFVLFGKYIPVEHLSLMV